MGRGDEIASIVCPRRTGVCADTAGPRRHLQAAECGGAPAGEKVGSASLRRAAAQASAVALPECVQRPRGFNGVVHAISMA